MSLSKFLYFITLLLSKHACILQKIGTILAVWALGPPDEDGNAWISEPAEAAIGIQRFEIHANKRRGSARTVTVEGLDAWAELAPFRLQLHPCPFVDLTEEQILAVYRGFAGNFETAVEMLSRALAEGHEHV